MVSVVYFKKALIYLGLILVTSSCQLLLKSPKPSDLSPSQLKEMDQALIYVKEKDFLKAVNIYDQLSKELRGKAVEVMMLFNSGSNYRNLGDCDKSIVRYRRMLERSLKQFPLKARGLMEIGYSYECLGDIKASFLSLKDAGDLRSYLPREVSQVIYPARLSISYSWFGKKKEADKYKSIALTGVLQIKNQYKSQPEVLKNMSRIFYFMGKSYMSKKNLKVDSFLQSFSYHQIYLLQSLFLKDKEWSLKSKKEMDLLFDKLHSVFLSANKDTKKKYKKLIQQSLEEGQKMIQMEKTLKWKTFYKKQMKKIQRLLV